ncbi:hypothetical protein PL336_07250 [Sulfitobacter faviae]|uniref:Uncharacterized protein n=1 Tax=Sulfitobacter faviae TaxID=1775881 RepID=A0AAX3LU49_9RHOB|nr:hypothetical protein [Sulfitobacter faviae]WCE71620.1 hypothetical protein PL336_07250 [Sulfitobacter faviae]
MASNGLNRWLTAVIAGIALNAGLINLSYFIGIGNTLPLQLFLGLASFFLLFRIKAVSIEVVCLSATALLLIALFNFSNPTSLITNPCIPLFVLMTALAGTQFQTRNQQTLARVAIVLLALQLVFHVFFNSTFSPIDSLTGRSKGYGSGTTYALLAATMLIYLTSMLTQRRLRLFAFCALAAVPLWTIFLTQSRGVFLSLMIILVVKNLFRMRSFFKLLASASVAVLIIALNPNLLDNVPLFDRLQVDSSWDLEAFSSGRLQTQIVIMNWISSEPSLLSLFLGAEGLNGVKTLTNQGLEFPHFDLLYLAYDTGFVGVSLYLFLMALLLGRTRFDSYILLFFLSALHTNMVLSPVFLIVSIVLHHVNRQTPQSTGPTIERIQKSRAGHSSSFETS